MKTVRLLSKIANNRRAGDVREETLPPFSGLANHPHERRRTSERLILMGPLKRLYERYDFVASAVLIDETGAEIPARISNISYGGCRLLLNRKLAIAAEVTVKIHAIEDEFEAPAKVVHSSDNDAGLMFGRIGADALFVLQKWIAEARYLQSMNAAE